MGIDGLQPFIIKTCGELIVHMLSLQNIEGKKIGIDLLNYLHKLIVVGTGVSFRYTNGLNDVITISTALTLYFKLLNTIVSFGGLPVSIFDGTATELKQDTQSNRVYLAEQNINKQLEAEDRIEELEKELKLIEEDEGLDEQERAVQVLKKSQEIQELKIVRVKAAQASIKPSHEDLRKVKRFLTGMGLPYIQAEGEAEKEGSRLVKNGVLWALLTSDGDAFAHGCRIVIKEVYSDPSEMAKRKKNGEPYVSFTHMKVMILDEILDGMKLSYRSFVDFCVMNGNDYCKNAPGFGSVANYQLIRHFKGLDDMPDEVDINLLKDTKSKKEKKPKIFSKWNLRCTEGKDYRHVRREFLEGIEHTDITKLIPCETHIDIIQELTTIKSSELEAYLKAHNIIFSRKEWISTTFPYYELYPKCYE